MNINTMSEPRVLAEAKEFLTSESTNSYVIVDSQFQQSNWGHINIPQDLQNRLQPINRISLRNGFPDAIVAPPDFELYQNAENGEIDGIPVAVIEAKGETTTSNRNTVRIAITQAHSHIEEVNLAYAAVPDSMVTQRDRALARELNIGLITVSDQGIELVEQPHVVGSQSSETINTIRFHAKHGGVTVENLTKNHPKNAIGYALAVYSNDEPDKIFTKYVIKSVDDARLDASALGLIGDRFDQHQLTRIGREAVRTISYHYGGTIPALEAIEKQTGSSSRFIDELPVMGTVARQVLLAYPPTQVLVNTLDNLAKEGEREPSLATVAKTIASKRPDFALDLFVSPRDRQKVFEGPDGRGQLDLSSFESGSVYSTHTTFQFKALLYHSGLLTTRGQDKKSELNPSLDVWALENPSVSWGEEE